MNAELHGAGLLSEEEWAWASSHLPIACVDILPVIRTPGGKVSRIGLILRSSPMGKRWCHLGGRLLYNETLQDGARRHLSSSIDCGRFAKLEKEPYFVNQYFPTIREGFGLDPRKHAIATCFLSELPAEALPKAIGTEALQFEWFVPDELSETSNLWPGSWAMIKRAS